MANRTGNYCAFYVSSPFNETNLGAHLTKDFCYYNMLRMWKGSNSSFPFVDSHNKNYNVRDGSNWELTLKPRLHDRLNKSKNIILFLSDETKNSVALKEEIEYGINQKGLPIIIIYPDYKENSDIVNTFGSFKQKIQDLWDKLPVLKNNMDKVPTLHIPLNKSIIEMALNNANFKVATKTTSRKYYF